MITQDEFLKALDIVNNYKIQVSRQFEEMNIKLKDNKFILLNISKDTLVSELKLSFRVINALRSYIYKIDKDLNFGSHWSSEKCNVKLNHFKNMKLIDLMKMNNIGKKSITEIKELFIQVGIIIN